MGSAAVVYANQLFSYGFGHALWRPEPLESPSSGDSDTNSHPVALGDVGYVHEDGSFRRLFNVTKDAGHELNRTGGVPEGFQPLRIRETLVSVTKRFLDPGLLRSQTVRSDDLEVYSAANVYALTGADISYKFECSSRSGALLVLKDYATKTSIEPNLLLEKYILDNHKSWYEFATDEEKFGRRCEPEDIVLVRGVTMTSAWTMAAFLGEVDRAHRFSASVKGGSVVSAGVKWSSEHSASHACVHRTSPERVEPLQDQCVFLNYYKVRYRLMFFPKVIKANAHPPFAHGDADPDDTTAADIVASVDDAEVEQETDEQASNITQLCNPLDDILDYILEHSNAEIAITSDSDLDALFLQQGSIGLPSSVSDALRESRRRVKVTGTKVGRLDIAQKQSYLSSLSEAPVPASVEYPHESRNEASTSSAQGEASHQRHPKLQQYAGRSSRYGEQQPLPSFDPVGFSPPGSSSFSSQGVKQQLVPESRVGSISEVPSRRQTVMEVASRFPGAENMIPVDRKSSATLIGLQTTTRDPIVFFGPGQRVCGVSCQDILTSKDVDVHDGHEQMSVFNSFSVNIQISWPGYPGFVQRILVRSNISESTSSPLYITRAELARRVVRVLQAFFEKNSAVRIDENVDARYKIGPGHIELRDLVLVGLQYRSGNSWQVYVRIRESKRDPAEQLAAFVAQLHL